MLVVSHDPGSAAIADRIVQIRDGRVSSEQARERIENEEIVVARGGWLRLPEELLRRGGIGSRATASLAEQGVVIEGTDEPRPRARARRNPHPATPAATAAIELRGVEKRVLHGLDADLHPGRLTVVTGPSGSGKTTLLHLIAGLDLPDAGEVVVLGTPIQSLDREARAAFRRDHIALVAQEPPLIPFLSVRENVELYLGLRGAAHDGERAQGALEAVGLAELAEQRVSRLSTGEQDSLPALASEPDLLIADEPTARLDYANALAIGELLSRIARDRGIAVVTARTTRR